MGVYETPVRRLWLVRAGGLFVLVIAFALIPTLVPLEATGRFVPYGFAVGCAAAALYCIRRSRRTPKGEVVHALPAAAPPAERRRMYRGLLLVSFVCFPLLSGLTAMELLPLESGETHEATLWKLLVPIYQLLGFWPTVLAPLLLGTVCGVVFAWKLRALPKSAEP